MVVGAQAYVCECVCMCMNVPAYAVCTYVIRVCVPMNVYQGPCVFSTRFP